VAAAAAPVVDGRLDDPAWQHGARLGPFVKPRGGKPAAQTTGRVACDGQRLYVAFTCREPNVQALTVEHHKRDSAIYLDDCVEIFVDANYDFRTYFHFTINAGNVQRDESGHYGKNPPYDVKWNAAWQSAVGRQADGWTVEVAIPMKTLGLDLAQDRAIGLNLCRSRKPTAELSCWAPTAGGFHEPLRFGTLVLARPDGPRPLEATVDSMEAPQVGVIQATGTVRNPGPEAVEADGELTVASTGATARTELGSGQWLPGQSIQQRVPLVMRAPGPHRVAVVLRDAKTRAVLLAKGMHFRVPKPDTTALFGASLPSPKGAALWWCESTYKVMKGTRPAGRRDPGILIRAAAREYEPFQLVIRPEGPLQRVTVSVSDLRCGQQTLSARHFAIHLVEYVPVTIPTDSRGYRADWPDPLPRANAPFDAPAQRNTPLWIVAYVPPDASPGRYEGHLRVRSAGGLDCRVPLTVEVYDFELAEQTHTRTAYGVSPDWSFLGIKTDEHKDRVYDLYMQSCRDHRISPYHPMARHRIKQTITGPQRRFQCGDLELVLDEYTPQYLDIFWRGKLIGSLGNTMTQFEKKGVGYKGTGVGWPGISGIKSVQVVERSRRQWVLDVTGEKTTSAAASRRYEITFRLTVPASGSWFTARMLRLTNTDKVRFEARGYYYILRHATETKQRVKGPGFAAWADAATYLGAADASRRAGLGLSPIYIREGAKWLEPGQSIDAAQPTLAFFVGSGDPAQAKAKGQAMLELMRRGTDEPRDAAADLVVTERTEPTVALDFTDFDKAAAKYLDEWKFNGFRFPCMPSRLGKSSRFQPGYAQLHKRVCGQMVEHLRQKGWLHKAYSYWFDEPSEDQYEYVKRGMGLLAANCPGLTRLLTEQPESELVGSVDLWVPVLSRYKPADAFERQAAGDQMWWYVCCGPRSPYPNNFIDHPAITHRIRFWMQEKYGVTGSLYWATTYWRGKDRKPRNPWADGMSTNPRGGHWGNGDGMLLYPACREASPTPVLAGPVVSLRWELLREGLEDREYFWTLRQELRRARKRVPGLEGKAQAAARFAISQAERALGAPDRLAATLTKYQSDPQVLLQERHRIAQAIELCRKAAR